MGNGVIKTPYVCSSSEAVAYSHPVTTMHSHSKVSIFFFLTYCSSHSSGVKLLHIFALLLLSSIDIPQNIF